MPLMGCLSSLSCLYSWKAWEMPRTWASRRSGAGIAPTTPRTTRGSGGPGGRWLAVAQRPVLHPLVEGLGDPHGLVERALDLELEPPLDRGVDEVRGDQEDQDRRRQREREKGDDELGLELRAEDLVPALEGALDQVAEEQDT